MTKFYDHTDYPAPGSRGTSEALRAEFQKVEQGFDSVETTKVDRSEIGDIENDIATLQSNVNDLQLNKENTSNKSNSDADSASTTKFPVWAAVVAYFSASRIRSILGISTLTGSNTGDETTATIQTKRPLKTINGAALEGSGDLTINTGSTKNKIINAQGLVNQRAYVSGTTTSTANQYTLDRWRVVVSGQNLTFSTSQNVTTFTAPAGGVEQVIEGLNIETGTYVLNWTGTATATVNGTAIAKGGTISLTGGSNATVRFINGTFSLAQLERGVIPTSFDYRDIEDETARCQRFGCPVPIIVYSSQSTGLVVYVQFFFPVQMRATPTFIAVGGSGSTPELTTRFAQRFATSGYAFFGAGTYFDAEIY